MYEIRGVDNNWNETVNFLIKDEKCCHFQDSSLLDS